METKKNPILKFISIILALAITAICILIYYNRLIRMFTISANSIRMIVLFVMFAFVLYSYIFMILKKLSNRKIILPILMLLVLILTVCGIYFIKDNVNYIFRNIILMLIFILGVVCLPIIVLGIILVGDGKAKAGKTYLAIILLIYTYYANFSQVINYAQTIVINLSSYTTTELVSLREEEKVDRTYLENYAKVYNKNGFLKQYDVKQILDIADSKSSLIYINYKDEQENIDKKITNKQDAEIQKLEDSLVSNYYKFNYEAKGNETTINIERYIVKEKENEEKNKDIILNGVKDNTIIEKKLDLKNKEYFYIKNDIKVENVEEKYLEGFKLLFVYDIKNKNYVPVVENIEEYCLINKYSISSDKLTLTLKNGVNLKNTDYTLRINRYNDNLEITNNQSSYYYDYEPVVTQETNEDGTNLVINFENDYTINELKNIEIIFGR